MRLSSTLLALSLFAAAPSAASAMGLCEDVETTYELEAVSESAKQVLVRVNVQTCEEGDDGEESRGSIELVQVRGFDGKVVRSFTGKDAEDVPGYVELGEQSPMKELRAFRRKGHFVAPKRLMKSPSGKCSAETKIDAEKAVAGEYTEAKVTLQVKADGKPLWSSSFVGDEQASHELRVLYLKKSKGLLVWADVGACDGPPPGYFDPDDPGPCYRKARIAVEFHAVKGIPRLSACF